jgi:hypothetical protein
LKEEIGMSPKFQVGMKKNRGNLHMKIQGEFDGSSACRLINMLQEEYDGEGEVVIDTHHLKEVSPFGCGVFQSRLNRNTLPAERLVFLGKKGGMIAPAGSRIISAPKKRGCGCRGNCSECKCAGKAKQDESENRGPFQREIAANRKV